jgi:(E)-4-hydroxy-3-methylbut-2-enyl-diphosphate synthase
MTNTKTKDISATIHQIRQLETAGCQLIRVAVLDMEDAKAIRSIVDNISIPLVADIHFDYRLAISAIEHGAAKIRLNPGNISNKDHIQASCRNV